MTIGKEDFVNGDKYTPARANQISKNANDGGGFRDDLLMGEAFSGATTPQAAYIDTSDNKLYICDGNDSSKLEFVGFVLNTGVADDSAELQCNGIVRGFSGLAEGEYYYVQDDKTIGTTPGTNTILVGRAISTTELRIIILKSAKRASGVTTHLLSSTGDQTIAHGLGSTPTFIKIECVATGEAISIGDYDGSNTNMIRNAASGAKASSSTTYIIEMEEALNDIARATAAIDATNITLTWSKSGSPAATAYIKWEAWIL